MDRMVVWDEGSLRVEDCAHNANEFVFHIVEYQASGFALPGFADEIGPKLRAMGANRTSCQIK